MNQAEAIFVGLLIGFVAGFFMMRAERRMWKDILIILGVAEYRVAKFGKKKFVITGCAGCACCDNEKKKENENVVQ